MTLYHELLNIRQSPPWQRFMESLGWKAFDTGTGAVVYVFKTPLGILNIAKMQKPKLLDKHDVELIDAICKKNKALFIKFEPNEGQDEKVLDNAGFLKTGYPVSPTITSFIDLTRSEKELWSRLSRSGKYGVNRARREGARVEFFQEPSNDIIDEFYKLHKATTKRNGFVTRGVSDIYKRRDAFGKNSYIALVYDRDGVLCSGKLLQGYGKMVLYTYGGTSDEGKKNRTGYLLMWETMLYLKKQGYELFDLEGMYDPRFPKDYKGWEGFTEFKEKFGVDIVTFPEPRTKFYNEIFKLIHRITKMEI